MVVRIRLARFGKRNNPFYNIVVAHARTARNSKPLEVLGTYNPVATQPSDPEKRAFKDVKLDISRAKYWIGVGAQPSDSMWKLLSMADILPPRFTEQQAREQAKKADRNLRKAEIALKEQGVGSMSDAAIAKKFVEEHVPQ